MFKLISLVKKYIKKVFDITGFKIQKKETHSDFPVDFDEESIKIIESTKPFTLTSMERTFTLIEAVKYIIKQNIPGDIVECGVWKGGSIMTAVLTLKNLKNQDKEIYLFDTFEGMSKPTEFDLPSSESNFNPIEEFKKTKIDDNASDWCKAEIDEVKENVFSTNYPKNKFHFIKGKVENTLPEFAPDEISILRLDTDWYESTLHELNHLFPKLSKGGVLIIDDYGFWKGSKKAVDEYFQKNSIKIMLNRIDSTGRIAIKQ